MNTFERVAEHNAVKQVLGSRNWVDMENRGVYIFDIFDCSTIEMTWAALFVTFENM